MDVARNVPAQPGPVMEHLGHQLRATYNDLVGRDLPARFHELVERLDQALSARETQDLAAFKQSVFAALRGMRAFALSLTHDVDRADDLVQETLMRAWANRDKFTPDTNLNAWLFTILRNAFHTDYRKRKREVEDVDGVYAAQMTHTPEQIHRLEVDDLQRALQKLPAEQREAVLLVGAEGVTYEEAAAICGVAIGTIKSRVNRARSSLAQSMGYTKGDIAADQVVTAAQTVNPR